MHGRVGSYSESVSTTAKGALRTRIDLGAADTSELGLLIPHGTSYETWKTMGLRLGKKHKVLPWQIGDWAFRGSTEFGNAAVEEIAQEAGFDLDEVRLFELVAGRFEIRRRRSKLTIHHHAQLALFGSDDVQDALLEQAEAEGLSVRQLKVRLKEAVLPEGGGRAAGEDGDMTRATSGDPSHLPPSESADLHPLTELEILRNSLTTEHIRRWRPSAEAEGLSVGEWLVRVADKAARVAV
jgi:hypothetical protein